MPSTDRLSSSLPRQRRALPMQDLIIIAALIALWQTPFTGPLQMLALWFHEFSHAVAAWLTGGQVLIFNIEANHAGRVLSYGGVPLVILSAGYVGCGIAGAVLLIAADLDRYTRPVLLSVATLLIAVTLSVGQGQVLFRFAGLAAALLALLAFVTPERRRLSLQVIGWAAVLYAPRDLWHDHFLHSHNHTDADRLAEMVGGDANTWALIWLGYTLLLVGCMLRRACIHAGNETLIADDRPAAQSLSSSNI